MSPFQPVIRILVVSLAIIASCWFSILARSPATVIPGTHFSIGAFLFSTGMISEHVWHSCGRLVLPLLIYLGICPRTGGASSAMAISWCQIRGVVGCTTPSGVLEVPPWLAWIPDTSRHVPPSNPWPDLAEPGLAAPLVVMRIAPSFSHCVPSRLP